MLDLVLAYPVPVAIAGIGAAIAFVNLAVVSSPRSASNRLADRAEHAGARSHASRVDE